MLEKFLDSPFATSQIQNTVTRDVLSPQSALAVSYTHLTLPTIYSV